MKLALSALLATVFATAALAQAPKDPLDYLVKDPAKVPAGAYVIEPAHTRVMFGVMHKGFTLYYGQFSNVSGTMSLDPKALAASKFDISVPTATVSTTNSVLDGELRDPMWMDAAKYPTITFKSKSVKSTGPSTADVTGDFTFHGVTKPLTLKVKFNAAGPDPMSHKYTVGFGVTGRIKRAEYNFATEEPILGDDVDLIISAAFVKAP